MLDVRSALRRAAGCHADRTAIISGPDRLTYGQAWAQGVRFANALRALGARPGDRIAVLEDNCLASSDFFLATAIWAITASTSRRSPMGPGTFSCRPGWPGGSNSLEPRFDAGRVLGLVADVGGYLFGVPTMVADLVEHARRDDIRITFDRLKAFVVSGRRSAPRPLAAKELFGPKLYQLYGQTECERTARNPAESMAVLNLGIRE